MINPADFARLMSLEFLLAGSSEGTELRSVGVGTLRNTLHHLYHLPVYLLALSPYFHSHPTPPLLNKSMLPEKYCPRYLHLGLQKT